MELSDEDKAELKRSSSDLSDICPCRRAAYERGMAEAYRRAEMIRLGLVSPLS